MISLVKLMRQILTETLSFGQLLGATSKIPYATSPGETRVDRGHEHVKAKSLKVMTLENDEAWTFNYKSDLPTSTTNTRYHGFVRFMKENIESKDDAAALECMVDCDCPDYRYRWAYNNAKAGSGTTGAGGLKEAGWPYHNRNNGAAPRSKEQGGVGDYGTPGLCKHLCLLSVFLKTKIDPVAPEPEKPTKPVEPIEKPVPIKKPMPPKKPKISPAVAPQTVKAPDSDDEDDYTDSRTGSDTLQENTGKLMERIMNFVRANPEFDVPYED